MLLNSSAPKLMLIVLSTLFLIISCGDKTVELTPQSVQTVEPLFFVMEISLSPDGSHIIMHVIDKEDDSLTMRITDDEVFFALSQRKSKIKVLDLHTQSVALEFYARDDIGSKFVWLNDNRTVLYQINLDEIVKLDVKTGERELYQFLYSDFDIHPTTGMMVAWGETLPKLVTENGLTYETNLSNLLVIVDPSNQMEIVETIDIKEVSHIFDVVWKMSDGALLIKADTELYEYNIYTQKLNKVLSSTVQRGVFVDMDRYNPKYNIFLNRSTGTFIELYDLTLDCVFMRYEASVPLVLSSLQWAGNNEQVIASSLTEARTSQIYLFDIPNLQSNQVRICLNNAP